MKTLRLNIGFLESLRLPLDKRSILISESEKADIQLSNFGRFSGEWRILWNGKGDFHPYKNQLSDWSIQYRRSHDSEPEEAPLRFPLKLGDIEFSEACNGYLDGVVPEAILGNELRDIGKHQPSDVKDINPIQFAIVDKTSKISEISFLPVPPGMAFRIPAFKDFKFKRLSADQLRVFFPILSDSQFIAVWENHTRAYKYLSVEEDFYDLNNNQHGYIEINNSQLHFGIVKPPPETQNISFEFSALTPAICSFVITVLVFLGLNFFHTDKVSTQVIVPPPKRVKIRVISHTETIRAPKKYETVEKTVSKEVPSKMKKAKPLVAKKNRPAPKPQTKRISKKSLKSSKNRSKIKRPKRNKKKSLNSVAKRSLEDQVGLLSSLKKTTQARVTADKIMNDKVIQDSQKSLIKRASRSPSGLLSKSNKKENSRLAQAKSSLDKSVHFDRKSNSVLAGTQGTKKISYKNYNKIAVSQFKQQVSGGLTSEQVGRALGAVKLNIRKCYEDSLTTNPNLQGKMTYRWTINPIGKVTQLRLLSSDIQFPRLDLCIQDEIQSVTFPRSESGQSSNVDYSFTLEEI